MTRHILIPAIIGKGIPLIEDCVTLERAKCVRFIGDQHNPKWTWEISKLNSLTEEQLGQVFDNPLSILDFI